MSGHIILPDGRRAWLTHHAADRWIERVRPHLELGQVAVDVGKLMGCAVVQPDPPDWCVEGRDFPSVGYVVIGDVALPVQQAGRSLIVPTVLCRGAYADVALDVRHDRSRRRRHRTRTMARKHGGDRGPRGQNRRELRDKRARETDSRRWRE